MDAQVKATLKGEVVRPRSNLGLQASTQDLGLGEYRGA